MKFSIYVYLNRRVSEILFFLEPRTTLHSKIVHLLKNKKKKIFSTLFAIVFSQQVKCSAFSSKILLYACANVGSGPFQWVVHQIKLFHK